MPRANLGSELHPTERTPPPTLSPEFDEWIERYVQDMERNAPRVITDTRRVQLNLRTTPRPDDWERVPLIVCASYSMLPLRVTIQSLVDVPPSDVVYTEMDIRADGVSLMDGDRTFTTSTGLEQGKPIVLPTRQDSEIVVKTGGNVDFYYRHIVRSGTLTTGGEEFPEEVPAVQITEMDVQLDWIAR